MKQAVLKGLFGGLSLSSLSMAQSPNIIVVMTDDQDLHHNSLDLMDVVQSEVIAKGTYFSNHWATDAQCCPSRATFLRGQQAHNTNITHVRVPGANYDKWLASGEDENYLPHWLNAAGYSTNYIGKLLNGHNLVNYDPPPSGWTDIDSLLEPYMYDPNRVVMSKNGARPVAFPGWHQTDIIRIKVLERLANLRDAGQPFFYMIAPTAPHNIPGGRRPQPLARYNQSFPDLELPKSANWNPDDAYTAQKPSWIKNQLPLNDAQKANGEDLYQKRMQTLLGIDELVSDVVGFLDDNDLADNTYFIYTTDNGYAIGNHRIPAVKCLAYREAGNLPFVVRGPGVPAGATSGIPSTHADLAPTFLEIAGVAAADFPAQFDGRSLLWQWHSPTGDRPGGGDTDTSQASKEIIQVEFWGEADIELPSPSGVRVSTFKALRVAGADESYLYTRWCTGEVELYDTAADPEELTNLAVAEPVAEGDARLMARLNTLLLIMKSCEGNACRDPWSLLWANVTEGVDPESPERGIDSLRAAMDPAFDDYFAGFPDVHFDECLLVHRVDNEMPFYPANATEGLGFAWRNVVEQWDTPNTRFDAQVPNNTEMAGTEAQRTATFEELMASVRDLTDAELGLE